MDNVNDETKKVKIPCSSEEVYREINRLRRIIKPKSEKIKKDNDKKLRKPIFKRSKKAQHAYEEQQENLILLAYMNDAVRDTYYSITGFRYYAEKLHIYVTSVMPDEESKEDIFVCAYNSGIYFIYPIDLWSSVAGFSISFPFSVKREPWQGQSQLFSEGFHSN